LPLNLFGFIPVFVLFFAVLDIYKGMVAVRGVLVALFTSPVAQVVKNLIG
jgi:hypothetical protein